MREPWRGNTHEQTNEWSVAMMKEAQLHARKKKKEVRTMERKRIRTNLWSVAMIEEV